MTLLAFWEVFQLLAFPDSLWLQPHKGLCHHLLRAHGEPGGLVLPRTRSREEVQQHLANGGDEEFRNKVTDEVRTSTAQLLGRAPHLFACGDRGVPADGDTNTASPMESFPFWGHLHKSVPSLLFPSPRGKCLFHHSHSCFIWQKLSSCVRVPAPGAEHRAAPVSFLALSVSVAAAWCGCAAWCPSPPFHAKDSSLPRAGWASA